VSLAAHDGAAAALAPPVLAVLVGVLGELPGDEPWRGEVLRRASRLQAALRERAQGGLGAPSEREAVDAAAALVGLGEGSTPAGDDYLVGVSHALRFVLTDAAHAARVPHGDTLLRALGALGQGRTTRVSAAWLAAAARGEASAVWRDLLAALAAGHADRVARAGRAVRETGHTSGANSLRGFLDTLLG
jgi:hypothetical protein